MLFRSAIAELEALGIGNAVSSEGSDLKAAVHKLTGGAPIVAAVDGVGGASSGALMSLLAEGGTLFSFGLMSGKPLEISASDLIFNQGSVKGFWLSKIMQTASRADIGRWMTEIVRLVASGEVKLQTGGIFELDRISDAALASAEAGRPGKILLRG